MTISRILFLLFLLFVFQVNDSNAAINFNINSKDIPRVKILFGNASKESQNNISVGSKGDVEFILSKIKNNLKGTDLFEILQKQNISSVAAGAQDDVSIEKIPDFVKYNGMGVGMLLIVDSKFNQTGDLEMKIRLWDVLDERQLFGKFYSASKNNYTKMASLISDEIFKAATGEKIGHFDSKITYIAESGKATKRMKRIVLMDFDGDNFRYLTNGRDLVLTPTFSSDKTNILFVRFFGSKPQIYNIDTNNALVRKIGGFKGTTFAPTVNPADRNIIAFSVIENGNSNIYQMNLFTNQVIKLTNTRAIDTTPSYSPDGKYIVFSSDRTGNQQLYIMNNEGRDLNMITSDKANYSKPVWSPDGKYIAFTKMKANQFSIGTIDANGRNEKTITKGYLVEGAKWSPNSRYLIYSKTKGSYGKDSIPRLYVVDMITGFDHEIPTPQDEGATDPDWIMN